MIDLEPVPEHEYRFHFLGGRPCLDLVATVGERWRRSFERLRDPSDLERWLGEAGLPAPPSAPTAAQLAATRRLREAIYRTARLAGKGEPDPADVATINAAAAHPPLRPELAGDGRTVVRPGGQPVEAALSTLARDAIDLVTGELAGRVRECGAEDCALLFVDTSRPGTRRWCSMAGCGNRAKAASHRSRVAGTAAPNAPATRR